jgi:hypothetical protein
MTGGVNGKGGSLAGLSVQYQATSI